MINHLKSFDVQLYDHKSAINEEINKLLTVGLNQYV